MLFGARLNIMMHAEINECSVN